MQKTKSRDRIATDAHQLSAIEGLLLKYPRVRPDELGHLAVARDGRELAGS